MGVTSVDAGVVWEQGAEWKREQHEKVGLVCKFYFFHFKVELGFRFSDRPIYLCFLRVGIFILYFYLFFLQHDLQTVQYVTFVIIIV